MNMATVAYSMELSLLCIFDTHNYFKWSKTCWPRILLVQHWVFI